MIAVMAALRIAAAALGRNRLRSALTTLGVTIGIGAVICTIGIGQGSAEQVQRQLDSLGDSFVWIQAGSARVGGARSGWGGARTLTVDDMRDIQASVPLVKVCSPQVSGREQLIAGNQNWNTRYTGVAPAYFSIRRWAVQYGGAFSAADVDAFAKVAVLGANVAQNLFGADSAVGKLVRIGRFPYTIVGVLQPRGSGSAGVNQDDQVLLPYSTALKKLAGETWLDAIVCSTTTSDAIPRVEAGVTTLLRERHRLAAGEADDFNLRSPVEMVELRLETTRTLGAMLSGIAAVSLLVGGIGIMNIMLVSVAERTREIGLRMAVGARGRDITRQFLVESLMLGAAGGVAGIVVGIAGARVLAAAWGWPIAVSGGSILVATASALAASLLFGSYPAIHASALDPVEALRTEA